MEQKNKLKVNSLKNKLQEFFLKIKQQIKPKLLEIDSRFSTFMPNQKLRKVVYIAFTALFSFMFLVIFLGILLSPLRNSQNSSKQNLFGQKPKIIQESAKPQVEQTENQKLITTFKSEIDDMSFPDTKINIPQIEFNLSINQSR